MVMNNNVIAHIRTRREQQICVWSITHLTSKSIEEGKLMESLLFRHWIYLLLSCRSYFELFGFQHNCCLSSTLTAVSLSSMLRSIARDLTSCRWIVRARLPPSTIRRKISPKRTALSKAKKSSDFRIVSNHFFGFSLIISASSSEKQN